VYCFCPWTVDSLNSLLTYGVFLLAWGFSGGTLLLYGSGTHGQRTQGFGHPGIKSLFCVLPFYYVSQYSLSVPNMETSTITIRLPIRHVKYYVRVFCSVYVEGAVTRHPPLAASLFSEAEGAGGCGGSEVRSSTSSEYYGTVLKRYKRQETL